MRIFAGIPWRGGVKQQWGNRKRGFSGFRTLRLRQLGNCQVKLTLYRMVMPIGTPFLKEKINN